MPGPDPKKKGQVQIAPALFVRLQSNFDFIKYPQPQLVPPPLAAGTLTHDPLKLTIGILKSAILLTVK